MKLALEALESKYIVNCGAWRLQQDEAITALRQAIAEAEKPDLAGVGEVGIWGDKREWVGLTADEVWGVFTLDYMHFARAIEAKLKEKNHG